MKNFKIFVIFIIFVFLGLISQTKGGNYLDKMVFDGSEKVLATGMDTTGHWWIITEPSTGLKRIIIDGKSSPIYLRIKALTFSYDGKKWAYYARDNVTWYLVTNDTIFSIYCDRADTVGFTHNSELVYYSYKTGNELFVRIGDRTIRGYNATGQYYFSNAGERFVIAGYRGDRKVLTFDGWETAPFDDIIPVGYFYDGSFIYFCRNGNFWEMYRDHKVISESFINPLDWAINLEGTVAAVLIRRTAGDAVAILISDEYSEPIISKPYDNVSYLALHPTLPMMAYRSSYNGNEYVVLSNTEFAGSNTTYKPRFTCDGSQVFFCGCNVECFINVDGRKYDMHLFFDVDYDFVMKPNSRTIAYSTSTTLVVRYLESKETIMSKMFDSAIKPIYNWRRDEYEALGVMNNRVYLLICKM